MIILITVDNWNIHNDMTFSAIINLSFEHEKYQIEKLPFIIVHSFQINEISCISN